MAEALEPLAESGADLQLVMVYRFPDAHKGAIEVHLMSGRKLISIANSAWLAPSPVPALLVEGDNRHASPHARTDHDALFTVGLQVSKQGGSGTRGCRTTSSAGDLASPAARSSEAYIAGPVPSQKLNPYVLVMQPTKN
jgi:hypothetical protein